MGYDATAERLLLQALFDLRGSRSALTDWIGKSLPPLPDSPNTRVSENGVTVAHLGPSRWLVRSSLDREPALMAALRPDENLPEISLVRVSDTMAFFRITGEDAAHVMATACPLDLHPEVFGADAASFTEFYRLRALLMRAPGGFDVGVEQSLAAFLADCLARALR